MAKLLHVCNLPAWGVDARVAGTEQMVTIISMSQIRDDRYMGLMDYDNIDLVRFKEEIEFSDDGWIDFYFNVPAITAREIALVEACL